MANPSAVLAEHGVDVSDGIDVKVVENAGDRVHITMPAPPSGHLEISDDALSDAAGGTCSATCVVHRTLWPDDADRLGVCWNDAAQAARRSSLATSPSIGVADLISIVAAGGWISS